MLFAFSSYRLKYIETYAAKVRHKEEKERVEVEKKLRKKKGRK